MQLTVSKDFYAASIANIANIDDLFLHPVLIEFMLQRKTNRDYKRTCGGRRITERWRER